ncbi:MAG: hypothetical protein H6624_16810 [Bdellovibrionaceae bacterium]|nr:hypothetical protein [Pseudobdellovibrionaceae bacterium]
MSNIAEQLENLFKKNIENSELLDLFSVPDRLAKKLPYEEFLEDGSIVVLKDESLGVIYSFDLVEHELMSAQKLGDIQGSLKSWLTLPSEYQLQVIFEQNKLHPGKIKEKLSCEKYSGHNSLADFLHDKKVETLLSNSQSDYPIFKRKGYLLVRQAQKKEGKTLRDHLPRSTEKLLYEETKRYTQRKSALEKTLSQFESLSPLKLERLSANEVISLVKDQIYGSQSSILKTPNYNMAYSLSEQIVHKGVSVDWRGRCGDLGFTRSVSIKVPGIKYPSMSAWFMSLPFPLRVSLQLVKPSKSKVDMYLNLKEFSLKNSFAESSKRQFEEIQEVKKKMAYDEQAIWLSYTVIVEGGTEEEVENRANEVIRLAIEKFDAHCVIEEDIGLALWYSTLPFCYTPKNDALFQRSFPVMSRDLLALLPVFDSCKGFGDFMQIFQSREGNLLNFSFFKSISSHCILFGDSGSGKSSFIGDLMIAAKRPEKEYLIFIIEMKTSYAMLTKFFGGEVNKFKMGEVSPSSPFRGVYDKEKILFLKNWIKTAVELTSPSFVIESELQEAIYKSIKQALEKKKRAIGLSFVDGNLVEGEMDANVFVNVDEICNELALLPGEKQFENLTHEIEDLLSKLAIFRGDGAYSSFRPREDTARYGKGIYLFDLEGLKMDPVSRDLNFLSIFEQIRQIRLLPENEDKEAILILDEIADLDRGVPMFKDIIESISEKSRKDGLWLFPATCNPEAFADMPGCKACAKAARYFAFTAMSDENLSILMKKTEIIDEFDQTVIRSLKTVRGKHSEIYIKAVDGQKTVLRYIQSPTQRWLLPTNIKEGAEAFRGLKKHKGDALEAIKELSEKYPHGIE